MVAVCSAQRLWLGQADLLPLQVLQYSKCQISPEGPDKLFRILLSIARQPKCFFEGLQTQSAAKAFTLLFHGRSGMM